MSTLPFLPLFTAISWTTITGVGAAGFWLEPPAPAVAKAAELVEALATVIDITPVGNSVAPAAPDSPPDQAVVDQVMLDAPPASPECSAMAEGSQVAFAIPTKAPCKITDRAGASASASVSVEGGVPGGVIGGVPVTRISVGKGFGSGLASPAYPEEARLNGWEGSVTVRFALDKTGRVMVAKVCTSSGRPSLDAEALRTVRALWKFPAGSPPGPFEWTAHFILR